MLKFGKTAKVIARSRKIAISGHINPDGDSIGSLLSLGLGLQRLGKRVYMISPDGVPKRYRNLPGAEKIVRGTDDKVDLAISVDCGNKEILGSAYDTFRKAGAILEIDHHNFRRPFGDISLIDREAAAAGEVIYMLLDRLHVDLTRDIAQNLMTAIVVETNSFGIPNVRPFTFEVCTKLMHLGIDFYKLVDTVYWSKRRESAVLSGLCMSRLRFLKKGKIAWSMVRKRDFSAHHGRDEDVDSVPDQMRSIKTVEIAVLFREKGVPRLRSGQALSLSKGAGTLRVSLRSKDHINVAAVAERYGGGGHFDMAGCTIPNRSGMVKEFLMEVERLLP